jgi:formate/nitrite transporter FocA (FNT family)
MAKRKTKPNKAAQLRQELAYVTGIEAAKRTISTHASRRYWVRGFVAGVLLGVATTVGILWLI